ncbi:hypothetical protein CsSME_00010934 [Camellia sinensis var. sinensis]
MRKSLFEIGPNQGLLRSFSIIIQSTFSWIFLSMVQLGDDAWSNPENMYIHLGKIKTMFGLWI